MRRVSVLLFLLICTNQVAFSTTIRGNNAEYSGETVHFFQYSDPITLEKITAFTIQFDDNGSFETEIQLSKPTYFFSDFGIYRGMLILEPGTIIDLLFPPLQEKSFADTKNPYFEPYPFWFNTENGGGTNYLIMSFEADFNRLTDQYFNQLYFRQSRTIFNTISDTLNSSYSETDNEFFNAYKLLRIKMLETDVFRLEPTIAANFLSSVSENFWSQPSFIDLLNKTFTNRLSIDVKGAGGDKLNRAISEVDVPALLSNIETKYNLKGEIAELALLKMLYDGFYSGDFAKTSILNILESENLSKNIGGDLNEIRLNILKKVTFLLPGTKAPSICLQNIDGYRICSDENKEKFKYLIFSDVELMVCQEQMKYLSKIEEQFQSNLEIILIMRNTDLNEMKSFINEFNVPGIKLVDANNIAIEEYKIKSFPTVFLLDKSHNVAFENAKAPLDGFEQQFENFMKSRR